MLKTATDLLLDLIFPPFCLVCGKYGIWLCAGCLNLVRRESEQRCVACGKPSVNGQTHPVCKTRNTLDGLLSAGNFEQLQHLIHSFKYGFVRELAESLSEINLVFLKDNGLETFFGDFCLVPVPLHKKRFRFRGFNQGELLAHNLSKQLGLTMRTDLLYRSKNTHVQTNLGHQQRKTNMSDAFTCNAPNEIRSKNFLLIDDIATTGSTLNECAKTLKSAGAKEVWALVLARA